MYPAVLLGIVAFWGLLYFFDLLFRTCQNYPYIWLSNRLGLRIHCGYARWYTTSLNRTLQRLGTWKSRFLQRWYSFGAAFAIVIIVPALALLFTTALTYLTRSTDASEQILAPALPGVNLPLNEVVYYLLTLLICSILHELGHATAAIREDVRVLGCGLMVLGAIPAAFVDLATDQLRQLTPWQQLRVFCAGVWHNVVLVLVAGFLFFFLPYIAAVAYDHGGGVLVTHVQEGSAASGPAGLSEGDHVLAVGECPVADSSWWYNCLAASQPMTGFCTDTQSIESFDEAVAGFDADAEVVECCPASSERGVCFRQMDVTNQRNYVCMPARRVIAQSSGSCNSSSECPSSRYACLLPSVDTSTKLLQLRRKDKDDMLYLGQPGDLYYSVTVSNYIPKWKFVPVKLPSMIETLCRYVISFSGALAMLNVVPCIGLDGQWIAGAVIDLLFAKIITNKNKRHVLFLLLVYSGTTLLVVNILLGVYAMM